MCLVALQGETVFDDLAEDADVLSPPNILAIF